MTAHSGQTTAAVPTEQWHALGVDAVLDRVAAGRTGLSDAERAERLARYGPNLPAGRKPEPWFPAPATVATVPAALGLWTTAADLIRFALGWSGLLPAPLAEEAVRPLARPHASSQGGFGLGWQVNESRRVAAASGLTQGAAASLLVKLDSGKVHVAMTNRGIPIVEVNGRVLGALADS